MNNAVFWDAEPVYNKITRRHIPEDGILHNTMLLPRCVNKASAVN
jgi:hypothetical protein